MRCFFCHKMLKKSQAIDRHHAVPRRYFKDYPGEDPDWGNIALAHVVCHRKAHQVYDRTHLPLVEFVAYMEPLDWLYGIFASPGQRRGVFFWTPACLTTVRRFETCIVKKLAA